MPKTLSDTRIGRRLRFRDLQVFFAVAECGGMAKGAAQLGVTQPAVSEIIAGIESAFAVRLFDRTPHGVELTIYGRALLKRGLAAFDELKQGMRDIEFLADPTVGEVRIGCPESIAGALLPPLVRQFCLEYPRIAYGVTAKDYEANLEANLVDLLERIKSGRYVAPPVRRVYIPKADGSARPLGIPSFEDKVAQRAIVMVLEPLYEQDFLPCSFGFRPGRSAHQALTALSSALMGWRGLSWVLDVDISKYYDTIQHHHLRAFLDRRVTDGVIRRMIDKWLKAGVLEHGRLRHSTEGTPQGGVISPLLANIYLHHVLDEWFEQDVRPRLKGDSILVRYADDCAPRRREEEAVM
jgi:DNA-binding transcriptional LysR family regulator